MLTERLELLILSLRCLIECPHDVRIWHPVKMAQRRRVEALERCLMGCSSRRLVAFILLCLCTIDSLRAADPPERRPKQGIIAEFDVPKGGDLLILPVTISGMRYPFALSLETKRTTFHKKFRQLRRSDGTIQLGRLKLPTDARGPYFDFSPFRVAAGHDFVGVIGANSLRSHIVRIDFRRGKVAFLSLLPANSGERHRMTYSDGGIPQNPVSLPIIGVRKFEISTFDNSVIGLNSETYERLFRLGYLARASKSPVVQTPTNGARPVAAWYGRFDKVSIGRGTYENLEVSERSRNRLGALFLSQFEVTIDFPEGNLYLKKVHDFKHGLGWNFSGIHFLVVDRKFTVKSIDAKSPGKLAGVHAGDVIVKVNNKTADHYTRFELVKLFEQNGKTITLTLRRNKQQYKVSFVLAEYVKFVRNAKTLQK
jgi:hypothetical protein